MKHSVNVVLLSFAQKTSHRMVPQVGFEPTRPKAEDFESTKSTSSITAAYVKLREKNSTYYVLKARLERD